MDDRARCGVWIDEREAVLFWFGAQREQSVERIEPGYGGTGYSMFSDSGEDRRRRERVRGLHQDVARHLDGADEIYVFGPGRDPEGLAKYLREDEDLAERIVAVETVSPMMQDQRAAWAREFFGDSQQT